MTCGVDFASYLATNKLSRNDVHARNVIANGVKQSMIFNNLMYYKTYILMA